MEALELVKSSQSGFPGISTRYTDPEGGTGFPPNTIDPVYEDGDFFSVDFLLRSPVNSGEFVTYKAVTIVSIIPNINIDGIRVSKKSSNIITLSGSPSNVFTDSYYEFIMKDRTIKKLPSNTTEDFLSVIRWSPPSTKFLYDVPYDMRIRYTVEGDTGVYEDPITIRQDVYWNMYTSLSNFRKFVSKGL